MVVFVPSYAFLNTVTKQWQAGGLMEKLNAKKKVRHPQLPYRY